MITGMCLLNYTCNIGKLLHCFTCYLNNAVYSICFAQIYTNIHSDFLSPTFALTAQTERLVSVSSDVFQISVIWENKGCHVNTQQMDSCANMSSKVAFPHALNILNAKLSSSAHFSVLTLSLVIFSGVYPSPVQLAVSKKSLFCLCISNLFMKK